MAIVEEYAKILKASNMHENLPHHRTTGTIPALPQRGSAPASSPSPQNPAILPPREVAAFTLIELLIVIAIIAILAGLGFGAVGGALQSAKKAEVRSMANQIKLALTSYYSEYGIFPTALTTTDSAFLQAMTGSSAVPTIPNRRGIRFLEVPSKFTNSSGIVTPKGYDNRTGQINFKVVVDSDYNGKIQLPVGSEEASGSIAVYVPEPYPGTNFIGTW